MQLKVLARTIVFNPTTNQILLVKNKGADFWYAPGGGWEYNHETILDCAKREVKEETGLDVNVQRLLYLQEFHESADQIFFETFWLAHPSGDAKYDKNHIDRDPNGKVETAQWFTKDELKDLKVFPKRLKDSFWEHVPFEGENPFIGVC